MSNDDLWPLATNLELAPEFSHLLHHLPWNFLIEEAVEDRVGAGRGHPHQMEDWEQNHHHLVIEEVKHLNEDTEQVEGKPAGINQHFIYQHCWFNKNKYELKNFRFLQNNKIKIYDIFT